MVERMRNLHQFEDLIPYALHSVPYIQQSHVFKAYCALENIYAQKPQLPDSVWQYCAALIRDDEPKVAGLIAPELLELDEIIDPTSGRDFGPSWILQRGLMPLSYWAMKKRVEEIGFPAVFQSYLELSLDHPRYLGHEISVLSGNWHFYNDVISQDATPERLDLFYQRFTEFVTTTFAQGNDTVFEHPAINAVPPESEILNEALHNPGFFGHNILAFVWAQRIKSLLTEEQFQTTLYNLTVLNRWHPFGSVPVLLEPLSEDWDDRDFDEQLVAYFLEGPTNTHQITLAEVLLWVWTHYPEKRRLVAASMRCLTHATTPREYAEQSEA